MSEIEIKSSKGKVVGKQVVHAAITDVVVSSGTIHRVVVVEEGNARQGTQSAKTRSEVRGGGRKPYKQKKTGNARQGTRSAPQWAHGGMALAVKPRSYTRKVNKKERRLATIAAFAAKLEEGAVLVIDKLSFAAPKTKDAQEFLKAVGLDETKRVLLVIAEHDETVLKSFRNIPNVTVRTAPNREGVGEPFSTRDLIVARKVVFTKDAFEKTQSTWTLKSEATA